VLCNAIPIRSRRSRHRRKGRRPSYIDAAPPEQAEPLYEYFLSALRRHGLRVESGVFRAMMEVELVNDGPVTLVLDTAELAPRGKR